MIRPDDGQQTLAPSQCFYSLLFCGGLARVSKPHSESTQLPQVVPKRFPVGLSGDNQIQQDYQGVGFAEIDIRFLKTSLQVLLNALLSEEASRIEVGILASL